MSKFHEKQADQLQGMLDARHDFYLVWVVTDEHYWLITTCLTRRYRIRPQVADELFKRGVLKKVEDPEFDHNHYQSTLVLPEQSTLELIP